MGRAIKLRGEALEEALTWLHGWYKTHELATVWHNGTQARRKGDQWVPKKSLPDYSGILTTRGGQAVHFDAKRCKTRTYQHPRNKLHQTDFLFQAHRAGALAFLLIVCDADTFAGEEGWIAYPTDNWLLECNKGFTIHLGEDPNTYPVPPWDQVTHGYIPDWLLD